MTSKSATLETSLPESPKTQTTKPTMPRSALSLRPDVTVMDAFVHGSPVAKAIIDAYRFNLPITYMTPEEFAAQNHSCTFHG
jgi:hypothetical protein